MEAINKEHGFGYLNPEMFEESIRNSVQFPIRQNPRTVFSWLEKQLSILDSSGGDNTDRLAKQLLIKGLSHGLKDDVFKSFDFWFQRRGALKMLDSDVD